MANSHSQGADADRQPLRYGKDGRWHHPTLSDEELESWWKRELKSVAEEVATAWEILTVDPEFRPTPDVRYLQYVQWKKGLAPNYAPTMADLFFLAAEEYRTVYGAGGAAKAVPPAENRNHGHPPSNADAAAPMGVEPPVEVPRTTPTEEQTEDSGGQTSERRKRKTNAGRKLRCPKLMEYYDEMKKEKPQATDEEIVKNYNRRYSKNPADVRLLRKYKRRRVPKS